MKTFLILIGMIAAGILGYSVEPRLRLALTGHAPEEVKVEPKRVSVELEKPKPTVGMVEVAGVGTGKTQVEPVPAPVPAPEAEKEEEKAGSVPVPEPTAPAPEPEPAPLPEPEITADPFASAEESPAEPAGAATKEAAAGSPEIVAAMQASIKARQIKEFGFDQVLDWQGTDQTETLLGKEVQVGLASYKAETVFGVKTIQAKALIFNGRVVRWIWPKSGIEIK